MSTKDLLTQHLPPLGRHAYLDCATIRRLVRILQPGQKMAAHVERHGETWRLRMSYTDEEGKRIRRGITLPDDDTAEWVRRYIQNAKNAHDEDESGKAS